MWGMKRTNIYLPVPMDEKLKALSEQTGLSVAELIRRAIDAFLKEQEQSK
jgi:predicted DNA-binding protein